MMAWWFMQRHFQATQLLSAGVPVPTVAARLGHADGTTTMKIYAHRTKKAGQQAADVVDDALEARRHALFELLFRSPRRPLGLSDRSVASGSSKSHRVCARPHGHTEPSLHRSSTPSQCSRPVQDGADPSLSSCTNKPTRSPKPPVEQQRHTSPPLWYVPGRTGAQIFDGRSVFRLAAERVYFHNRAGRRLAVVRLRRRVRWHSGEQRGSSPATWSYRGDVRSLAACARRPGFLRR